MMVPELHRAILTVNAVEIQERQPRKGDLADRLFAAGHIDPQFQHGVLGILACREEAAGIARPGVGQVRGDLDRRAVLARRDLLAHVLAHVNAERRSPVVDRQHALGIHSFPAARGNRPTSRRRMRVGARTSSARSTTLRRTLRPPASPRPPWRRPARRKRTARRPALLRRVLHPILDGPRMGVEFEHAELHPADLAHVQRLALRPIDRAGPKDERRRGGHLLSRQSLPAGLELAVVREHDPAARLSFLKGELAFDPGAEGLQRAGQEHQQPACVTTNPNRFFQGKRTRVAARMFTPKSANNPINQRAVVNVPLRVFAALGGFLKRGPGQHGGQDHDQRHRQLQRAEETKRAAGRSLSRSEESCLFPTESSFRCSLSVLKLKKFRHRIEQHIGETAAGFGAERLQRRVQELVHQPITNTSWYQFWRFSGRSCQ